MNMDLPLVVPEPGMVIEFYVRSGRFDFLVGFCRGLIFSGKYVIFVGAFRRGSDPAMSCYWAEPYNYGTYAANRFVFGFVPESDWMTQLRPEGESA